MRAIHLACLITHALGGMWHGSYGVAPCPICQPDRRRDQDALTLSDAPDGRLLAHCKKAGCSFRELAAAMGLISGTFTAPDPAATARRETERWAAAAKKARIVRSVWAEALPIGGTVAEAYLRGRGITCALPNTLRFHPECWHSSGHRLPAMVATVQGCDLPAVHRTYLRADGSGKADVDPPRPCWAA